MDCASCSPSRFGFAEAALYRWSSLTAIDRAFENAAQVFTPYAASGLNKFVAENGQAYLGADDPNSLWPTVTRARLAAYALTMLAFFAGIDVKLKRRPEPNVLSWPEIVQDRDFTAELLMVLPIWRPAPYRVAVIVAKLRTGR